MESGELMRQKMSRAEEDETSDSNEMVGVGVQHHGGHLPLLVTGHVHSSLYTQCCQLVVFFVLQSFYKQYNIVFLLFLRAACTNTLNYV